MGNHSKGLFFRTLSVLVLSAYITACDSSEPATSSPSSPTDSSNPPASEPLIPEPDIPGSYDDDFRSASIRFLPQYRWEWLKSQCYQESAFDTRAISPAGAMGLCQFMPRTWDEVTKILGFSASPFDPKANTIAASYYMGRLVREWNRGRPDVERLRLAQASYNGGLGTILKAQTRCNDALLWKDIAPCVLARETREYVPRIAKWYFMYTGEES